MNLYFDAAATAIPDANIAQQALELSHRYFANPSSAHSLGKQSAQVLQTWRCKAAKLLHVQEQQIIFVSSSTEANQLILLRLLLNKNRSQTHIVAPLFEHASVYENLLHLQNLGCSISWVAPEKSGHICPQVFVQAIQPHTRLATIMLVNNETGAIQNIPRIVQQIRSLPFGKQVHIHVDATQAMGRVTFDLASLGCDSLCLSSHKMGGPRGAGILYMAKLGQSLLAGGGQEFNMRSGTENLFAIIGCVLALEKTLSTPLPSKECESIWLKGLHELNATFLPANRLSNPDDYCSSIITFAFPPLPGEVLVRILSEVGLYVNTGSACGSHKKDHTRALTCLGIDSKIAECAVRASFDTRTTPQDCQQALHIIKTALHKQKQALHF